MQGFPHVVRGKRGQTLGAYWDAGTVSTVAWPGTRNATGAFVSGGSSTLAKDIGIEVVPSSILVAGTKASRLVKKFCTDSYIESIVQKSKNANC